MTRDAQGKPWTRKCAAAVIAVAAVILWISIEPLWPKTYYQLGTVLSLIFAILVIRRPALGGAFLVATVPIFGNHPGGRFVELWDLWLLLWAVGSLWADSRNSNWKSPFAFFSILFWLVAVISLSGNWQIWMASGGFSARPFDVLSADENSVYYSLRITLRTCLILLAVLQSDRGPLLRAVNWGALCALVVTVLVAWAESLSPEFAQGLDHLHVSIDGYSMRTPQYPIFQKLTGHLIPNAANSLFWNRTWCAVFMVAALPFALRNLMRLSHKLLLLVLFLSAMTLTGARGGWIAAVAFIGSYLMLLRFRANWMIYLALAFHILSPFGIFMGILGERGLQFRTGIELWGMHLLWGGGLESYGFMNEVLLTGTHSHAPYNTAHNQWLQILSGTGLVGGALYCSGILFAYHQARRAEWRAAWICYLVYSSVQEWWYMGGVMLLWWLLVFASMSRHSLFGENRWLRFTPGVAPVAILLSVIYAFADLRRNTEIVTTFPQDLKPGPLLVNQKGTPGATFAMQTVVRLRGIGQQIGDARGVLSGSSWMDIQEGLEVIPSPNETRVNGTVSMAYAGNRKLLIFNCVAPTQRKNDPKSERACFYLRATGGVHPKSSTSVGPGFLTDF